MKLIKNSTLFLATISAAPKRNQQFWDNIYAELANIDTNVQVYETPDQHKPLVEDNPSVLIYDRPGFDGPILRPILPAPINPKCQAKTFISPCRLHTSQLRYTFNSQTGNCESYYHSNFSFCLPDTINNFETKFECETICQVKSGRGKFKYPDGYMGNVYEIMDVKEEPIKKVAIAKSGFNFGNNFQNRNSWRKNRRNNKKSSNLPSSSVCNVEKSTTGFCRGHFGNAWTFDSNTNSCEKFTKGGCDNLTVNIFSSLEDCENVCK